MYENYIDKATKIRQGEEINSSNLQEYLTKILSIKGNIEISQFPNGFSNLTYLIKIDKDEFVLRRPPHGAKIKTGHDMFREFNILSKLFPFFNKIPKVISYCEDVKVIGAPFYLMEKINGVIIRGNSKIINKLDKDSMGEIANNFINNFVELHSIDIHKSKLNEIGKIDGYNLRQIKGWIKRYNNSIVSECANLEKAAKWLLNNIPEESSASLIHNDYKYDNIVLNSKNINKIISVLDWEMSTIGDPLMDLGTTLGYWINHNDPDFMKKLNLNPSSVEGNPTRDQFVNQYALKAKININNLTFYYVYGLFKIAVIIQQIYFIYNNGLTKDIRVKNLNLWIEELGLIASQSIDKKKLDNLF